MYHYTPLKEKQSRYFSIRKPKQIIFSEVTEYGLNDRLRLYDVRDRFLSNPSLALKTYGRNFSNIKDVAEWEKGLIEKKTIVQGNVLASFSLTPYAVDKNRKQSFSVAVKKLKQEGFNKDKLHLLRAPTKEQMIELSKDTTFMQKLMDLRIHYIYVNDGSTAALYSIHQDKFLPDKNVADKATCLILGMKAYDQGITKIGDRYKTLLTAQIARVKNVIKMGKANGAYYEKLIKEYKEEKAKKLKAEKLARIEAIDKLELERIRRYTERAFSEINDRKPRKERYKEAQKIKYEQKKEELREENKKVAQQKEKWLEEERRRRSKCPSRGDKCNFISITMEDGEQHTLTLLEPEEIKGAIEDVGFVPKFFDENDQKEMSDFLKWRKCLK